ncbi:hypothetical protein GCM10007907_18330 [Chitinimonas prasina]|uniref:YbjN domain-containing protein n=1 Tax=Chitinimonas prasina TaxID=1434937 RepID=A0ABQ5YH84_9NEIS|nr:hypothetical protein [Chitinimonas prasina]GLR13043.1 hypothetical protein GCM10007907_18330 [Chitinimonas prasina]
MKTIQALLVMFRKSLLETRRTFVFSACEESIKGSIQRALSTLPGASTVLAVHVCDEGGFFGVASEGIFWEKDQSVSWLQYKDISIAKIDLAINRDLGFLPGLGLRWVTVISNSNERIDFEMENGSSAEAFLSQVKDLMEMQRAAPSAYSQGMV